MVRRRIAQTVGALLYAFLSLWVTQRKAWAADDPYLDYWTIETPHFRIHYAKNIEPVAERTADLAEDIHRRLSPLLGHSPTTVTHVVLSDNSESANGSATALPYNAVHLLVTGPDDMSPLADYEDWLLELVTHEYTHILHLDNIHGVAALANAILGKNFAPNQEQPRWITEGLAVLEESKNTSGGRNRSSIFDMYLRADTLEDHLATLDQMSHGPRRWPMGNIWYLYGSRFLTWISDTYGADTMKQVSADYGNRLIPYGINRSMRRAVGKTYEELYDEWTQHLRRLYHEQINQADADSGGRREGKRLTFHGRTTTRPRWVPESLRKTPATPEVLYYRDDSHRRTGFYRLPIFQHAASSDATLWVRANGTPTASFDQHGNLYLSLIEPHKRVHPFSDLSRVAAGQSATGGHESSRTRLTRGLRAIDPDVRNDGKQIAYSVNRRGTNYLSVADVLPDGTLGPSRVIVPTPRFELAQTPRYSPDGRWLAYSSWTAGGYRDLRLVEVATGAVKQLTYDRANDLQPSWSPDGQTLYFSSDRTGIPNIYAYDLATQRVLQVTNVHTGAFMPEVSPDGRQLVYVGYTSDGFDLFLLDVDPTRWVPAREARDDRPPPLPQPPHHPWPRHPYEALSTLWPRAWQGSYGPGTYGQTFTVNVVGQDAVGFHTVEGSLATDTEQGNVQTSLSYTYGRLPFDLTSSVFRTVSPNRETRLNNVNVVIPEENLGWSNTVSYAIPRAFDSWAFSFSHTLSRIDSSVPLGAKLDPQALVPVFPAVRGYVGVFRAGVEYSNVERYLYSVGPSRGFFARLNVDAADRFAFSDYSFYAISYNAARYFPMPWHPDHILVTALRGAFLDGSYPRRGVYYTGGFVDVSPIEAIQNSVFQGGFLLRGYPPLAFRGRQYHVGNLEYRAPLWHPERGISTLPVFFNRLSGAIFADYGGAFDSLTLSQWSNLFHLGYGAEVLLDATFGYFTTLTSRIGYARGSGPQAYPGGKVYFVLSMPY